MSPSRPRDDADRCHVRADVIYLFVPSGAPRREPRRARRLAFFIFPFFFYVDARPACSLLLCLCFLPLCSHSEAMGVMKQRAAAKTLDSRAKRCRQEWLDGCHDTRGCFANAQFTLLKMYYSNYSSSVTKAQPFLKKLKTII